MKKNNWKKKVLFIVGCMIPGFIAGLAMGILEDKMPAAYIVRRAIHMMPYLYVVAFISALVGLGSYFYFNMRLKKENYSDEEGSFYEKNENLMSLGLMCATLSAVINLTALGVNEWFDLWFIVNALLALFGEIGHIALIRKVRPELNADPMEKNFSRKYFDKLDECEKYKVGKASMQTITAMTPVYVVLFLSCYLVTRALGVSAAICLPIGIIWAAQTILYTYYCIKAEKK